MDNSTTLQMNKHERKKILALLGNHSELYTLCYSKIYTSNSNNDQWLYSNLEGHLCFVLDYQMSTRFFVMFEISSYERLFQFELYNNFSFQKLSDEFLCFEYANGFIGLKFESEKEASELLNIVSKFSDFLINTLLNSKSNNLFKYKKKEIIPVYLQILKDKFSDGKLDHNYVEDGLEIRKPRYFELLNNITFDREKNEFRIGNIPEEFKAMFKLAGIKKSDIKDPKSALNIIKNIMDILDNETNRNSQGYKVRNRLDIEEKFKSAKDASSKKNSVEIKMIEVNESKIDNYKIPENKSISNTPNIPIKQNIPTIPNVPKIPNIPNIPKIPANLPKITSITLPEDTSNLKSKEEELQQISSNLKKNQPTQSTQPKSMIDEMRNVTLRKVETQKNVKISKNETNVLQNSLAEAIKLRRMELTKHDINDSIDGDSDDWSD